jgi:DNA polymerase I-like protein with 3'-5' exonuclease and polymerase domains
VELARLIRRYDRGNPIAIDTEGLLNSDWFWSIQVSLEPGTGYVLRAEKADFGVGIDAIRSHVYSKAEPDVFIHSAMHDFWVTRNMGLELSDCNLWDTRYAAYIQRIEPQGLKGLSARHEGMVMDSYLDLVGGVALEKQLEYLMRVYDDEWPAPEARLEYSNDGTCRLYTPQPVGKRAFAILSDFYEDKRDKDGNPVDPAKRWKKVDYTLRQVVESRYGAFPIATLADVPLAKALRYAARDPDATLRLGLRWQQRGLTNRRFLNLWRDGNAIIPVFEEMQAAGMLAHRPYMERMSDTMWEHMCRVQQYLSHKYWQDRPFNPASSDQVATLMRRRGLIGEKRSKKTGKVSTAKKSIEHLRYVDDAIANVIDWREHQKMKDAFYDPIVEIIGPDRDSARVHTDLNPYKVDSRRISSSNPNLTAIPVRNELGKQVRDGFEEEDGYEIGSWDQSQIEMRYMAHLSRDPKLVDFFNDPRKDVHGETAAAIFGLKVYEDAETKEDRYRDVDEMAHRYPAKRAGFGIITNISGAGLLDQLRMFGCKGWDQDKCDDLIREWLRFYKGVNTFLVDCKNEVARNGMVYCEWGMPKFLPGIWSEDRKVAAAAGRAASSHKISAGAQGMMQRSLIWLRPYIRGLQAAGEDVRFILQIHDEVLIKFRSEGEDGGLWPTLNPLVTEALTQHGKKLIVPVKCSGSHNKKWGKLK